MLPQASKPSSVVAQTIAWVLQEKLIASVSGKNNGTSVVSQNRFLAM